MSHRRVSILGLSLFLMIAFSAGAEESGDEIAPPGMVKVIQRDLVEPKPPEHDFTLKTYHERRGNWGLDLGFAYSAYNPASYQPQFLASDYADVYGGSMSSPLMEGEVIIKRNMSIGSVGIEIGAGAGSNDSNGNVSGYSSTLSITEVRVGAIIIGDMFFSQPYVAPYFSAGGYLMMFSESQGSFTFKGNTQVAPYITVGAQIGLDWLDPTSAREVFEGGDIQATHLFIEMRKYFASSVAGDPDFSSGLAPGAGLRVEF